MSNKSILLADNSKDVVGIFQAVFGDPDYSLRVAKSTAEALAQVFIEKPDIIVLDGDTTEKSSVEILKTIRANSATQGIPTLIILPEDNPQIRQTYDSIGICDFVIKPITPEKIRSEVESLIKGSNLFGSRLNTKIISFCGVRGGAGTTSLAINCATSLLDHSNSVLLLEHANYFSGIKPALSLSTRKTVPFLMCEDENHLTEEHILSYITEHPSGIQVVPTISGISDMEKMDPQTIQFMRFHLCPVANYTIFDAGYGMNEAALELFDISDMVVFVASLDIISLYNIELTAQVFEGTRLNLGKCRIIFNHIHSAGEIPESTVKDLKNKIPILGFVPNHAPGFLKAMNNGLPYVSMFPKSPSAKAIRQITAQIHELLNSSEVITDAA